MRRMNSRELKFAILEYLARDSLRHEHKMNLLGSPMSPGAIERAQDVRFDDADRFRADRAFETLMSGGLIRPTYNDLISPEKWVTITDAGRRALERRAFDDLDEALRAISPTLVEMRDGAWAAAESVNPDARRQSAHSARELVDQTLKLGAPDEAVRAMPGFRPDPGSR